MRPVALRGVVQAELPVLQQVAVVGLQHQAVIQLQRAFPVVLEVADGIDRPVKLALAHQFAADFRRLALRQFLRHGHGFHRERIGLRHVQIVIAGGEADGEQPQAENRQ